MVLINGKRHDNSVRGDRAHLDIVRNLTDVRISELAALTGKSHTCIRNNVMRLLLCCKDDILAFVEAEAAKYEQEQKK